MLWNAVNGQVNIGDSTMNYASFGRGEKVLIVLPGLSDGLATVKGKALLLVGPYKPFLDRYTVYMFSRKDEMPEGYSIQDMADDQAKALENLGLNSVSVLGVSQGGMIAQSLAIRHPEVVEKLVIAVSAPKAGDITSERIAFWLDYAEKGDHKSLMIDTAEHSYSDAYLKKYRKAYPIIGMVGKPADYSRFFANAKAILNFDATAELSKINCPTLIIGGSEDKIVGVDGSRELNELIPGSELFIYEGLGHAAYEEAKDFYARVFAFLVE